MQLVEPADTAAVRKARGAFFTPEPIAALIADWAVRDAGDRVFEPSSGDAEFLVAAVRRLRDLSAGPGASPGPGPEVDGAEIHAASAAAGRARVAAAGGSARIEVGDFFTVAARPDYDAVIGNPPYVRFQDFSGEARARARGAALAGGVQLTGLASSWAAFTVHASRFLRPGGRLGLVLPAELLSVNYAAAVRRYLLHTFASVRLVVFDEQVFPGAEADVVLLLADGAGHGPAAGIAVHRAIDATGVAAMTPARSWAPRAPGDKWTALLLDGAPPDPSGFPGFDRLQGWGETTLGMVTGSNRYFVLPPGQVRRLGLRGPETLAVSPPGSAHLRGLELTHARLEELGAAGRGTRLFRPSHRPSPAAGEYLAEGRARGVHLGYKARTRAHWYQVPLVEPADLLLTCMNADTPRLVANRARVRHLNSVHGLYVPPALRAEAQNLLPLAAVNSVTMLSAELAGRSYGGGILKLEPREADDWIVPTAALVRAHAAALTAFVPQAQRLLAAGELGTVADRVDEILHDGGPGRDLGAVRAARTAREQLKTRRMHRGRSGR